MSELNELQELAMAALDIPDLARGVEGEVEITGGWGTTNSFGETTSFKDALIEVHEAQFKLVEAGWRRDKEQEELAPFSHNIEVACYRKQFKPGQTSRWVTVTVATRFGLVATFTGRKELSW